MPVIRTAPAGRPERPLAVVAPVPGPVAWEPCAVARPAEPADPVCERCGWLVDEHVDVLPTPAPLRRAS